MTETVECSECRTRYDSDEHPFCPRCGSTAHGASVAGALASAQRHDPGRRLAQAAGVVLISVAALFLLSATISLLVPQGDRDQILAQAMAHEAGGHLAVRFPAAGPATVNVTTLDGAAVANATTANGTYDLDKAPAATLRIDATQGAARWNRTVVVSSGDTLAVDLPAGGDAAAVPVAISHSARAAVDASRWIPFVLVAALAGGGVCALLLRLWAIAMVGVLTGVILGLLALAIFGWLGILFAAPFGFCAYAILRGKRHFT